MAFSNRIKDQDEEREETDRMIERQKVMLMVDNL